MRGRIYSMPVKFTAVLLSILACLLSVGSIFFSAVFMNLGFFNPQMTSFNYYQSDDCHTRVYYEANNVVYNYFETYRNYEYTLENAGEEAVTQATLDTLAQELNGYRQKYEPHSTNFRFALLREDGSAAVISTYAGEKYGLRQEYSFTTYDTRREQEEVVTIQCYVVDPLVANDAFMDRSYWISRAFEIRYLAIGIAVISAIFLVVNFVYLMCAAGRKKGEEGVIAGGLHTVPFDLLTVMVFIVGMLLLMPLSVGYYDATSLMSEAVRNMVIITSLYALFLFYIMSFAIRCKKHMLWKGTLIYRVYAWLKARILQFYHNRSIAWKGLFWVLLIGFTTFMVGAMCIASQNAWGFFLYVITVCVLLGSLMLGFQVRYRRIQNGIRQIAAGDLNARVDTKGLYNGLKEQAKNLNHINAAVQTAVEEQLKSERMKTELITNVSHDIKTPLTSIVNYVDLLKKQQVQDETANEYIEVLERQSIRLKKLIEDLIDASKASTGNMKVEMTVLDTTELLKQVTGEYTDRLASHNLELVLTAPEHDIPVLADGQLLWRVFDNLLSNAMKYSQAGTRVYLDLKEESGVVTITFRNISKYPLNISSDELMERFVRGDSSRHTEGSGLGLSIARSLTELMNGRFGISVDGDLFKAEVSFIKTI